MATQTQTTFYSVLVGGDFLSPNLILPKKIKIDRNGQPIKTKFESKNPKDKYICDTNKIVPASQIGATGSVYKVVTNKWQSEKTVYADASGQEKSAVNGLKAWLSDREAMVFYHGTGCDYNGPHIHVITPAKVKVDADFGMTDVVPNVQYKYKKMTGLFNKAGGYCKLQKVKHIAAQLVYLSEAPRVFFGANCSKLLKMYYDFVWGQIVKNERSLNELKSALTDDGIGDQMTDFPEDSDDEDGCDAISAMCGFTNKRKATEESAVDDVCGFQPKVQKVSDEVDFNDTSIETFNVGKPTLPTVKKHYKKKPLAMYIDTLLNYMLKYNICTRGAVVDLLTGTDDPEVKSDLKPIVYNMMFTKILNSALELYESITASRTVFDFYPRQPTPGSHSALDMFNLLCDWCIEQRIEVMEFTGHLFEVMSKLNPKINAFAMVGSSNAGKSFWFKTLIPPCPSLYGQVSKSPSFMWQDCVHKALILMEEAMLSSDVIETFKIIAGGQEAKIDVKFQGPQLITRTPVLIASNNTLWKYSPQNAETIKNRVRLYDNLKFSQVLNDVEERLVVDQYMWYLIFDFWKQHDLSAMLAGDVSLPDVSDLLSFITEALDNAA